MDCPPPPHFSYIGPEVDCPPTFRISDLKWTAPPPPPPPPHFRISDLKRIAPPPSPHFSYGAPPSLKSWIRPCCGVLVRIVFHKLPSVSVCCRELEDVLCILSLESVRLTCILDHPEFTTVCLNPLVLRVALAGTVTMRGEIIPLPLERNPFVVLVHCTEATTRHRNTHL